MQTVSERPIKDNLDEPRLVQNEPPNLQVQATSPHFPMCRWSFLCCVWAWSMQRKEDGNKGGSAEASFVDRNWALSLGWITCSILASDTHKTSFLSYGLTSGPSILFFFPYWFVLVFVDKWSSWPMGLGSHFYSCDKNAPHTN